MYALEPSRAGTGPLAALANFRLFGEQGLRVILGHIVEMTPLLREHLDGHEGATVLNRATFGIVTLFRTYPIGVDSFLIKQHSRMPPIAIAWLAHNGYNREISVMAGRGVVVSITDCYRRTQYGEPIVALKSFILSPRCRKRRCKGTGSEEESQVNSTPLNGAGRN